VLVNAIVSGTLVAISVLLFPLKERVSATFEVEGRLTNEAIEEFPLWFQAIEELKLVLVYAAAQGTIIFIGYHPDPIRKGVATALSFLFLFATFSLDFISPLLQRHQLRYSRILKALALRPLLLFGWGGLVAVPAVLGNLYVAKSETLSFDAGILIGFSANLVSIVLAVIAGTWVASKLLLPTRAHNRPSIAARLLAWLLLVALLAANGYVYGNLGQSLHHKSQILKCHYKIVPDTFAFSWPKWGSLLSGKVTVGVAFDLEIENPTAFDLELEKSRLEVRHEKALVAMSKLAPLRVPSKQTAKQRIDLKVQLAPTVLRKGRKLLEDHWSVTLFVQVTEHLEFPIYLRHTFKKAAKAALEKR
jgi:hypothetical protein